MTKQRAAEDAGELVTEGLSIYGYPQCPYCQRVFRATQALGIEIELRDIMSDDARRSELIDAMGRGTVPVLRIEDEGGEAKWLPESADIVAYLESRFGASDPSD